MPVTSKIQRIEKCYYISLFSIKIEIQQKLSMKIQDKIFIFLVYYPHSGFHNYIFCLLFLIWFSFLYFLFFFPFHFIACKYHSMMCTCVVLVHSEPESQAFNPIIAPLKSCDPITHDAFKKQNFLVSIPYSLNQNLWKWFHESEFLTSVLVILIL